MKNPLLLAFVLTALCCDFCFPANIRFLPGDAFFPTELSAEQLAELRKSEAKKFVFNHTAFDHGYFFCGSAGYASAQIESLDQKFVEQLIVAYKQMRQSYFKQFTEQKVDEKLVLKESNPMRVLFYPADFDYPNYELGLQYNENWAEETQKFGHVGKHLQFLSLVDDKAAIIEGWQRSKEVAAFKFDLPKVKQDPDTGFDNPIILKGPLKAIVVPAFPLKDFVYGDKIDDVRIVEQDGVYQYESKENDEGLPIKVKVKAK